LWTTTEAWQQGGENLYRHNDAKYFLPSEDEWYKAAYYDPNHGGPGIGGYWNYATGSDNFPAGVAGGTGTGTAVYGGQAGPADITNAGGLSPYGTMAQNGNAWEWCESAFTAPNDSAVESRVLRGGYWYYEPLSLLQSSDRSFFLPGDVFGTIGFRVAAVPE